MSYIDMTEGTWDFPDYLPIDGIGDELLKLRKIYIREWELCLDLKKEGERSSNIELSRFARGEASEWLKMLRACRLLIPWFAAPTKDCLPIKAPSTFPKELFRSLNLVIGAAEMATW